MKKPTIRTEEQTIRTERQARIARETASLLLKALEEFDKKTKIYGWGEVTFCRTRFGEFRYLAYVNWYYHPADFPSSHTGYRNLESDNYGHAYSLHKDAESARNFQMSRGWEDKDEYNHQKDFNRRFNERGIPVYVSQITRDRILKSKNGVLVWKRNVIDRLAEGGPRLKEKGGIVD